MTSVCITEVNTRQQHLSSQPRFLQNCIWNASKIGNVVGIVVLMQEGIVSKGLMIHNIYLAHVVFCLISLRIFEWI